MPESGRGRWKKSESRTLLGSRPESPRNARVARAVEDPLRATAAPAKASWLSWRLSLPLACLLAAVALLAAGYRFPTFAPAHHDSSASTRDFSAPSRSAKEELLRALVLKHHPSPSPVDGASAARRAKASRDKTSAETSETTFRGRRHHGDDVAETGASKTRRRAASKTSSETRGTSKRSHGANVADAKRHHHERLRDPPREHPHERRHERRHERHRGHHRAVSSSARATWSVDENGVLSSRPATFASLGDASGREDRRSDRRSDARPELVARLGAEATAAAAARGEATGREVGEAMVADIAAAADRALDDARHARDVEEITRRETMDARRRVASIAVDPAEEVTGRENRAERIAGAAYEIAAAESILSNLESDALDDDDLVRRVAALASFDDA